MKLKKVLSICKTNGLYYLYDRIDRSGEITQWLGDACALYPLDGLPILDEESFCAVFDITGKQREKILFRHDVEAFARGVYRFGMKKQQEKVLCLCIGTGAGSAFLENGEALKKKTEAVPENGWIYNSAFRDSILDDYLSVRGLKTQQRDHGGRNGWKKTFRALQ